MCSLEGNCFGFVFFLLSYLPFFDPHCMVCELDSFRKTFLWIAFFIPSCVLSRDLTCLVVVMWGTGSMLCCGCLSADGWGKAAYLTDLDSQTAVGYYHLYRFDGNLARIWKRNLIVEIWKKQWFVFSLTAELGFYPGAMLHQLDFTFS